MLKRGITQILYIILMGVCFIGVPAVSDSAASIVMPQLGTFGDEVTITAVNGAGVFAPAQALLFMNREGVMVERVPVTVVSSTTVYASIPKLEIEPGTYTLALDIGAEEPLLLDVSFLTQSPAMEVASQPPVEIIPELTVEITPEPILAPTSFTITAQAEYGGVINPVGAIAIEPNAAQEFSIIPDLGYTISSVIVDGETIGSVSQYTFDLVTDDHTITAQFGVESPPAPEGKVSIITDSDPHTKISPSGSLFVDIGTPLTFTIKAAQGSEYTTLRINGEEAPPERVLRITADTNYVIQSRGGYEGEQSKTVPSQTEVVTQPMQPEEEKDIMYTIVSRADAGGTIEPFGEISIMAGSAQTFSIIPEEGYQIKAVMIDGTGVGETREYTFENVQESHSIRALFER